MRVIILIFIPLAGFGQSYFGSSSNPVDGGELTATTVAVSPPPSMQEGDLAIMIGQHRSATGSITVSNNGGQNWSQAAINIAGSSHMARVFWTRFSGVWESDPSLNLTQGGNGSTVVMHVFRPTSSVKTWGIDQSPVSATYTAPSSPCDVTRTGQTSVNANGVMLAMWFSVDDNTWEKQSGSFSVTGENQYRNTGGIDISCAFGHFIFTTSGSGSGDATWRQATLGCDAGATAICTWYEYTPINRGIPVSIIE